MSREFLAHGFTLTLAWFVAANVAMSIAIAAASLVADRAPARRSARFWMTLRLAPATVSILFAIALFVPSYWKYEPRQGVEGFDISITIVAVVGLLILMAAAARGMKAWLSARRRVRHWMAHARPMTVAGTSLPAYAVDVDQPTMALVGILRPKLLLTRGLLDALTPAELDAAVAHEIGHVRGLDNLKRLLMCAAPDLLTPSQTARAMERRWAAAAEQVADCLNGPDAAAARCALASALVKVARLTPVAVGHAEPISTLISGGEIAARVYRLLNDDPGAPVGARRVRSIPLAAFGTVLFFAYGPLLRSVHEITEVLVRALP